MLGRIFPARIPPLVHGCVISNVEKITIQSSNGFYHGWFSIVSPSFSIKTWFLSPVMAVMAVVALEKAHNRSTSHWVQPAHGNNRAQPCKAHRRLSVFGPCFFYRKNGDFSSSLLLFASSDFSSKHVVPGIPNSKIWSPSTRPDCNDSSRIKFWE